MFTNTDSWALKMFFNIRQILLQKVKCGTVFGALNKGSYSNGSGPSCWGYCDGMAVLLCKNIAYFYVKKVKKDELCTILYII